MECDVRKLNNIVYCSNWSWREYVFKDRFDGGVVLAELLSQIDILKDNVIVYGLVAGGVPVAYSVAKRLKVEMDVIVVKKILYPWTTEAGFGAVTIDGNYVYDEYIAHTYLGYDKEYVQELARKVHEYVYTRTMRIRGTTEYPSLNNYTVILIDDGIATGYTMVAGLRFLRKLGSKKLIAAAPTACSDGAIKVASEADEVLVVNIRNPPYAVADAYKEWHDLSDEEVIDILNMAEKENLYPPKWMKKN
ncbi:MAG: phosphoribosyltransferase [Thermoprotei archaeon]|nr:MAG: phosphoribosyltransferase [Thermoprotei archaeon]